MLINPNLLLGFALQIMAPLKERRSKSTEVRDTKKEKVHNKEKPNELELVCNIQKEPSNECFHVYSENLKRLMGGDFKKNFKDEKLRFSYPTGSELTALLDIGAEAERRNEAQYEEMECYLQNLTQENQCLQQQIIVKNNALAVYQYRLQENQCTIDSLKTKLGEQSCNTVSREKSRRDCIKEELINENKKLHLELQQLRKKYCTLKEDCANCGPPYEMIVCKEQEIIELNKFLNEKEAKLQTAMCQINDLEGEKCLLQEKICSLNQQLKSQLEDACCYQKTIKELENQVVDLEQSLSCVQDDDCLKKHQVYNELLPQITDLEETCTAKLTCEKDRILQDLIAKIELRDKNLYNLKKIECSKGCFPEREYEKLKKAVEDQGNEIDRLTQELQNTPLDDTESVDLLNQVSELQNFVCDSLSGSQNCLDSTLLERRIKKIRCRIRSRLQREEARKQELTKQVGIYRSRFMTWQKEIEDLRCANCPSAKNDIEVLVNKERILKQLIYQADKQRKALNCRCQSLTKALTNLNKVNELVMHLK